MRRILTGDGEGALAGMRIRTVLHPAVHVALSDGSGFRSTEIAQPPESG